MKKSANEKLYDRSNYTKVVNLSEDYSKYTKKHKADITCPLTAGIFVRIVAEASLKREENGNKDTVAFYRTLKNGELNEKYPVCIAELIRCLKLFKMFI